MWILLVVMVSSNGAFSTTSEAFNNKNACESAAKWFNDSTILKVKTVCLPKGD